jgi:hypothetical protein
MDIEARFAAMEARLRAAEDQLEIIHLLTTYGPMVDADEPEAAAACWVEGGFHQSDHHPVQYAPGDIAAVMGSQGQRDLNAVGCTHFYAPPRIALHGDTAEAVGYSFVALGSGPDAEVVGTVTLHRAAINYWVLVRTPEGWRIKERLNRAVNGSPEARRLMQKAKPGNEMKRAG